jgi:hypothetical protein
MDRAPEESAPTDSSASRVDRDILLAAGRIRELRSAAMPGSGREHAPAALNHHEIGDQSSDHVNARCKCRASKMHHISFELARANGVDSNCHYAHCVGTLRCKLSVALDEPT